MARYANPACDLRWSRGLHPAAPEEDPGERGASGLPSGTWRRPTSIAAADCGAHWLVASGDPKRDTERRHREILPFVLTAGIYYSRNGYRFGS